MALNLNVRDSITASVGRMKRSMAGLPKEAYHECVKNTPIDTGNARRKTTLQGHEIQAKYPYAKRLDEGYSKQAPRGMVEPTEKFLQKRLKQIIGKK
jgi:hypothetical protein